MSAGHFLRAALGEVLLKEKNVNTHLSKDGELGKSRLVPRFGSTTIIGEPGPNQAKLCVAGGCIIIGRVDRKAPIAQASREWEILDLGCVIVSVAREESQARERTSGAVRAAAHATSPPTVAVPTGGAAD